MNTPLEILSFLLINHNERLIWVRLHYDHSYKLVELCTEYHLFESLLQLDFRSKSLLCLTCSSLLVLFVRIFNYYFFVSLDFC